MSLTAQTLTVRIVDENEQPIPGATVFIRETSFGLVVDERGGFQTTIDPGNYTFDISSLGYERKTMTVSIPPEGLTLLIKLTEKIFSLREVTVTPGKEDPAYRIMRNVIARAPYHLHQIKSYESEVYFKGSFMVNKVPALMLSQIKEPELKSAIGKLMVYESQNEIKFEEPDKYEQRLIALSTTIPASLHFDDNIPLIAFRMNIYDPKVFGGMMGPGSFSVYKFHLEETYRENDLIIHKINIIPRKNNGQLVSGHLYVVDNTWSIQRTTLSLSQAGITLQFNLSYHEVKPGAFIPSASNVDMDMNIMGIKGNGKFFAAVKYNKLETNDNPALTKTGVAAATNQTIDGQKTLTKKQQQTVQKIEELAAKEQLTTREAYKMAQLIEKTVETDEMKEQKRRLELRSADSTIRVVRDSLALLRDTSFWNKTRVLPLRDDEILSYLQRDSIRHIVDSLKSADSLQNRTFGKWMSHLLLGDKLNFGKRYFLQYPGLLYACQEYNFVDGYRIGQRLTLGINLDRPHSATSSSSERNMDLHNRSFSISPAVYYTTARKQVDFIIDSRLTYAPMRRGSFTVSTGNTTADFAGVFGPGRFGNTINSILFAGNSAKFYQKRFITVANDIDIANGLILTAGFNYEKRNDLENNTSFNLFNRQPASNRPHGQSETMPDHASYTANITLQYTPQHYFRVWNGQKHYVKTAFPTFRLSYKKGFAGDNRFNASFDNIEASLYQSVQLNLFNQFYYRVNAGTFLSAKQTCLPDYKHFHVNEKFLSGKSFNNSFIMDNYRYATNERWMQAFVAYSSQYLLLKHIPFMQRALIDEAVHLKTLWTPDVNHNEAGYSIGLGSLGRLGVFVCFRKQRYDNVNIVLTIPLFDMVIK